jgi:hypothetical protein
MGYIVMRRIVYDYDGFFFFAVENDNGTEAFLLPLTVPILVRGFGDGICDTCLRQREGARGTFHPLLAEHALLNPSHKTFRSGFKGFKTFIGK